MRFEGAIARLGAVLLVFAATGWSPLHAQDAFQQGLDAYLSGEYRQALELWQPVAEAGDEVAAFNVGVLYARGLGVEANPVEAVRWYRQSALAGYANAQFNLGAAYYNGIGVDRNTGQAIDWWQKAAEQNHAEAMYNLGALYRDGTVVEQDTTRALELFEKGAAAGDARADSALQALRDRAAADREQDAAPAGQATGTAAPTQSGDWPGGVDASHWAVQLFAVAEKDAARRFVLDNDLAEKVRIYRTEVDGKTWFKGVTGSHADSGAAQAARDELERMLPGASPWIRRYRDIQAEVLEVVPVAVEHAGGVTATTAPPESSPPVPDETDSGGAATVADTGERNEEAESPPEEDEPAEEAAAETGEEMPAETEPKVQTETEAQTEAGDDSGGDQASRLREGQRAFNAQDYDRAFTAWQPLAEQGVADAQYGIGFMYESGWGVDQDFSRAYRWYQLAAQQGHVKSQFNLGMLYRNGNGVAQNDALGLYWIQTAADRGDERALSYLKNLNQ